MNTRENRKAEQISEELLSCISGGTLEETQELLSG